MKRTTTAELKKFKDYILNYYRTHKRSLVWRNTTNPYYILVSEVMLQQTQVARVITKYDEFIKRFPTITSLSNTNLSEVLIVWQGMGYNRRALYLKKIAEIIVNKNHGRFPISYDELIKLPGIGKNTAGSILAFAFNKPSVFIETNIRRVYIHHFFNDREDIPDKDIITLVEKTLDFSNPREWYYALMDYGTYLSKVVENPNRKSRHYIKQSPLKGSVREVRGKIITLLTKNKSIKKSDLKKMINVEDTRFEKAYSQLIYEKFIKNTDDFITIS